MESSKSQKGSEAGEVQGEYRYSVGNLLSDLNRVGIDRKRLSDVFTKENHLGHGGNAEVYAIPGVEQYVIKVANSINSGHEVMGEIEDLADIFPEHNFGQAIARVSGEPIYFLKKQFGIPAGVPYGEIRRAKGEAADRMYEEHLRRTAAMPQSAYDELLRDLMIINERDCKFDPSKASNVLVDFENERFNVLDIERRRKDSEYTNSAADMVIVLMDNAYAYQYKGTVDLTLYRKIILDKCLEAGKKFGWQIPAKGVNASFDHSFTLAGQERK